MNKKAPVNSEVRLKVPEDPQDPSVSEKTQRRRETVNALFRIEGNNKKMDIDEAVFALFRGAEYVMLNDAVKPSNLNEREFSLTPKSIDVGADYYEIVKNEPYPKVVGVTINADILKASKENAA